MTVLKKKPKARKHSAQRTASFITHATKVVARILVRWIEKIIEVILGLDQFVFRRGKRKTGAVGMLRISERTMDVDAAMLP
jgi:hypothetical protein